MFYETHDGEDMFEPTFAGESLESVRSEVDAMKEEFSDCMREKDMGQEELESLCVVLAGDDGCNYREMAEQGTVLLDKIQEKLKTAAEDLQRFDGESAAATNSTGHRADRLTKAATVAMHARERLQEVASV